jgi:hypothetical protein
MKKRQIPNKDQVFQLLIHPFRWLYFYLIKTIYEPQKTEAMKTTKLFTVLSLILIFVGINTVYPGNGLIDKPQMTRKINIKYEVNVYLFSRIDLCNTYLVQVTDETGRLVAPPKIFVPGVSRYIFAEEGPAQGKVRVAMLLIAPDADPYICPIHIGARPDVKMGPFLQGETYPFVLRPILTAPLDKE